MKAILIYLALLTATCSLPVFAHGKASVEAASDRFIQFPDVEGKTTMVVDLHTHSVFSDGHVWPTIRVAEALKDGLDAFAVTEHLEWQPHLEDIPHPDRNRSYNEALTAAEDTDLMVIRGSEITRESPAGHINAIFIQDSNPLFHPGDVISDPFDPVDYYRQANEWPADAALKTARAQGAFIFWNHPYWTRQRPDGIAQITKFHKAMIKSDNLHGIEIANGAEYSEEAHAIALKHKLVLLGVSDVHNLIDWDYTPHTGGHRPVTLVFTNGSQQKDLKDALFAGHTVVWHKNLLIGRQEELAPLLDASLTFSTVTTLKDTSIAEVTISNHSDANFQLRNTSAHTFMGFSDLIVVPPHASTDLRVKIPDNDGALELSFDVLNALVAPKKHPVITFTGSLPDDKELK